MADLNSNPSSPLSLAKPEVLSTLPAVLRRATLVSQKLADSKA